MNNYCMVANHAKRKVITFCLDTKCQSNRVCCSVCQTEFHSGHFDQLVDCEFLLNFIESQVEQPNSSSQVGQILTQLSKIQNYLAELTKQIQLQIERLSSSNLQTFCKSIGSHLKNDFESFSNRKLNDILENMLSYVQISNSLILEKSPFVYQGGKEDFINQSTSIVSHIEKSFKVIQSILNQKEKNSENQNDLKWQMDDLCFNYGIDVCKQRSLLAFGTDDSMLRLWNLENNSLLRTYPNSGLVYDVIFSYSGDILAFGGSGDYTIKLVDIQDLKLVQIVTELRGHDFTIRKLLFSQDSTYLISASDDKTLRLWNVKAKEECFKFNSESQIKSIAVSKENSFLASYSQDEYVRIWRIKDQKLLSSQPAEVQRAEIKFLDDKSIQVSNGHFSARKILIFRQKYGIKRIDFLMPQIYKISFMILIAMAVFIMMRVILWICGFTINGPSKNSLASHYQSYIKLVNQRDTDQQHVFQQLFGILQSMAMGNWNYLIIFSILIAILVQSIVQLSKLYTNRHTNNRVINI